jgi:hypothetical protein
MHAGRAASETAKPVLTVRKIFLIKAVGLRLRMGIN